MKKENIIKAGVLGDAFGYNVEFQSWENIRITYGGPILFSNCNNFIASDDTQMTLFCLEALKEALCQDTILVSIMYVNNEIGSVQPIEAAVKIVKNFNPRILFHSDAVQGFGKYHIYPKRVGIDMLSASGHKIHGPKGTGFLYINEKVKIKPIIFGGEQQKNIRSGTENVPGIAGLGLAAKMIYQDLIQFQ